MSLNNLEVPLISWINHFTSVDIIVAAHKWRQLPPDTPPILSFCLENNKGGGGARHNTVRDSNASKHIILLGVSGTFSRSTHAISHANKYSYCIPRYTSVRSMTEE